MPRAKVVAPAQDVSAEREAAPLLVVQLRGVYSLTQVRQLLRLEKNTLRLERSEGRLRVGRIGRRYFVLGEWLFAWLASAEVDARGKLVAAGK